MAAARRGRASPSRNAIATTAVRKVAGNGAHSAKTIRPSPPSTLCGRNPPAGKGIASADPAASANHCDERRQPLGVALSDRLSEKRHRGGGARERRDGKNE